MKRFQFPFERVLEWRDRKAETERNKLEQLNATRAKIEQQQELLAETIGSSQQAFASVTSSAEDLRHLAAFVGALRTKQEILLDQASECKDKIGAQTRRCVDADRDHQLLVRLRDRQKSAWQYELDRETEQCATESWLSARARELGQSSGPRDL
jgi:flagellar export protein FliJ